LRSCILIGVDRFILYIEVSRHEFFREFGTEFQCAKRGCLGKNC
jgi:hypothetical protein